LILANHDPRAEIDGAQSARGGTRTPTPIGQWHLKPSRLPVPTLARKGRSYLLAHPVVGGTSYVGDVGRRVPRCGQQKISKRCGNSSLRASTIAPSAGALAYRDRRCATGDVDQRLLVGWSPAVVHAAHYTTFSDSGRTVLLPAGHVPRRRLYLAQPPSLAPQDTLDKKYPAIIRRCREAIDMLMPGQRAGVVQREGCVDVSLTSKHWPCLFPQHGPRKEAHPTDRTRTVAASARRPGHRRVRPWPHP
jgi:hypothetical protein